MEAFRVMARYPREFWLYAGLATLGLSLIATFIPQLSVKTHGIITVSVYCLVFMLWARVVYRAVGVDLGEPDLATKNSNSGRIFLYGILVSAVAQILILIAVAIIDSIIGGPFDAEKFIKIIYWGVAASIVIMPVVWLFFAPGMLAFPGRALGYGTTMRESGRLSEGRRSEIWRILMIGSGFSLVGSVLALGWVYFDIASLPGDLAISLVNNFLSILGVAYVCDRLTRIYIAAVQADRAAPAATPPRAASGSRPAAP